MKAAFSQTIVTVLFSASLFAQTDRAANTVILDQTGVENLGIETEAAEMRRFESTAFAIGRIEEIPSNHYVLSSRIAGRVIDLAAYEGDRVRQGDVLVRVESRVAGDPPPVIELKAPRSGLVTDSHVRIGEPVEPSEDLLDISDRSQVWAVAKIPELAASSVKPGTKARIRIPALGGQVFEAELLRYGVEADRAAAAVEGIFVLENPNGQLQPGMRAEFSIIVDERENVLSIPKSAVQGDPARRVVFVEDFDLPDAFVRVPVVLGEENDEFVEVIRGLFPADEVVTRGSYGLSFVGSGSGISLKEALDAAHGHEHNEDGSEMTPEQVQALETAEKERADESIFNGTIGLGLAVWAGVSTVLAIVFGQVALNRRRDAAGAELSE